MRTPCHAQHGPRTVPESAFPARREADGGCNEGDFMNKALIRIGAGLAAVLLSTSACGSDGNSGGGGGSAAQDTDPAAVKGTLRLLVPSYPASTAGKDALQKVVDSFHEKYPKVTVEPDFATFDTLNEKISTSIASGQPYDVYVTGIGWIPPFASKGLYADLAKFGVTETTLGEQTDPAMIPAVTHDGKLYGVPLILGPKPLAYSKKAFEAAGLDPASPPATWAELREAAKKLTKRDGGKITQAGFDFWAAPGNYRQDFVTFLGSKGVSLFADGEAKVNGPPGGDALNTMAAMINEDKVTEYGAQSSDGQPLVFSGKAAMGFAGGYIDCAKVGQDRCDDLAFFNLKETEPAMFSGGQLASIGVNSKLSGAAYAFVQALSTPEAEADIAALNFAIPAGKSAASGSATTNNPASTFAAAHLGEVVFEGGTPEWLDIRGDFGPAIDKVLLGKASAQEVLDGLAKAGA